MTQLSFDTAAALVAGFYEAAHDPLRWQDAMDRMHKAFDCSRACLFSFADDGCVAVASVEDPALNSATGAAVLAGDPLGRAIASAPPGEVFSRERFIDEHALRRRELWNDWLGPRDMVHDLICVIRGDGGSRWTAQLHRGAHQDGFGTEERAMFAICTRHIARAGEIGKMLGTSDGFAGLFRDLPFGILLVDRAGRATEVSASAERMLAGSASPLRLHRGRLSCRSPGDDSRFGQVLSGVLKEDIPGTGGTLVLGGEGMRTLVATIAPFTGERIFGTIPHRQAIVILRDVLAGTSPAATDNLRALFGLSTSEARLCQALAAGQGLREAATTLNVTFKTARTYLDRIFAKTGTHQQSHLISLLKAAEPLT